MLIRRTHELFGEQWNVPAGYVEIDEDPLYAVVREVYEETGLQVEIGRLVNVYFFNDDPRGNEILIAYQCHIVGGKLTESAEGTSPTFFAQTRSLKSWPVVVIAQQTRLAETQTRPKCRRQDNVTYCAIEKDRQWKKPFGPG